MKKILQAIKFEYNSIINSFKFWKVKREANKKHKLTGKRYHVVPFDDKTLGVVDNSFIKAYNKTVKGKQNKITIDKLLKMSYYSTPVQGLSRNGNKAKKEKSLIRQIFS